MNSNFIVFEGICMYMQFYNASVFALLIIVSCFEVFYCKCFTGTEHCPPCARSIEERSGNDSPTRGGAAPYPHEGFCIRLGCIQMYLSACNIYLDMIFLFCWCRLWYHERHPVFSSRWKGEWPAHSNELHWHRRGER